MPLTVFHSKTATTPDNTSAEIRPSNWNEAHVVSLSLAASEVIKAIVVGAASISSGSLAFANANGVSFGMNNGTVTASIDALTSQSVQTQGIQSVAAGGNTLSAGGVVFSNANGVSFGLNNSTMTASVATAAQTNQSLGLYASSQTTGAASSTTVDARSLSIVGAGGVSVGMSAGRLVISGTSGGAADGINRLAAGTQTAGTNTTVNFADSNGITFGMSGSNQITASHDGLRSHRVSAANGSSSVAGVSFADSNGVQWSLTNGSVVASFTGGGGADSFTQYAVGNTAADASSGTQALSSLQIRGAGIASVGISNDGAIVVSVPSGGGVGDGGNILAAGTQTATSLGTVAFVNSNGLTFGMSGSTQITASHNGLTSQSNQAVSGANGSFTFQTLSLSNANGVSFGTSAGSAITASVAAQTNQTVGLYASSNTTAQSSSSTADARSLSFRGAGIISVGMSAGQVVISASAAGAADGFNILAAGTQTAATNTTVVLSNSNNVSFGMSGSSQITASAVINVSGGTTSNNLSALTFSNANGVSFGLNASTLTASVAAQSAQTIGVYASSNTTAQSSSSTVDARSLSFRGAGAASVGVSAGEVVISVAAGAQTNQTAGIYAVGNTTGQSSSSTYDARTLSVDGAGIVSAGWSNGTLRISATQSNQAFSASGGSSTFQTLGFSNGNGATFTNTNGSVGLSYTVPTQVSAYAQSNTTQSSSGTLPLNSLQFAGAGAVSVGVSNGSVVISGASPGAATLSVYGVGNTTQSSSGTIPGSALSVRGSGIVSVGVSNGSLVVSAPDAVDFTQLSVGFSTGGNTAGDTGLMTGRVVFAGGANITLSGSTNGGSQTISIVGGAGGGGVAISAGTQSVSTGTMVFSNSNNISFGMSGSSRITASYNFNVSAGTTSNNLNSLSFSNGSGVSFGLNAGTLTASVAAQTNQTVGLYASSQTTGQSSSTTVDARSLSVRGAGGVSVGYSAGELIISGGAGGGVTPVVSANNGSYSFTTLSFSNANGVSFGTSAGSAITASVAAQTNQTIGVYASSNTTAQSSSNTVDARSFTHRGMGGVSVGMSGNELIVSAPATSSLSATGAVSISVNGATISIGAPAASTAAGYFPYADLPLTTAQVGQGSLLLDPQSFPNVSFDRIFIPISYANSSNSTGSHTISYWVGVYSRNASTLSLVVSGSYSRAVTGSGTVGSYSNNSGMRHIHVSTTSSLSEGKYWIGLVSRSSSAGADATFGNIVVNNLSNAFVGFFGSPSNATYQMTLGQGFYSATTSGMPSSIAFSEINGSVANAMRQQAVLFGSNTV